MAERDERLVSVVSNKALSVFLVFVLVFSVSATMISLYKIKGNYSPGITMYGIYGTVQTRIQGFVEINVNNNVDFGNGTISTNDSSLTWLSTYVNRSLTGNATFNASWDQYGSFNNCSDHIWGQALECRGIEIENTGNVNVNVTFNASATANNFFSGNDAQDEFDYFVMNGNRSGNETSSCGTASGGSVTVLPANPPNNWVTIPITPTLICANLSYTDTNDTITVEFNLTIPTDEPVGTKTNTLKFVATQI